MFASPGKALLLVGVVDKHIAVDRTCGFCRLTPREGGVGGGGGDPAPPMPSLRGGLPREKSV